MATRKVKKVAVATTDIGGLLSSRYEKLQASYGVIAPTDYAVGDSIVFADVPSKSIIRATVVAHDPQAPAVLDVYPGSDKNNAFTLSLPVGVSGPVEISYIIEYVRGTGRVGTTTGDNSGEGDLFTVVTATSSKSADVAETQVAKQKVTTITTTQAAALATSTIAAFSTAEVATITTGDLRALATAQVFAFSTTQVAAFTTAQLAAFTTAQQAALQS